MLGTQHSIGYGGSEASRNKETEKRNLVHRRLFVWSHLGWGTCNLETAHTLGARDKLGLTKGSEIGDKSQARIASRLSWK